MKMHGNHEIAWRPGTEIAGITVLFYMFWAAHFGEFPLLLDGTDGIPVKSQESVSFTVLGGKCKIHRKRDANTINSALS